MTRQHAGMGGEITGRLQGGATVEADLERRRALDRRLSAAFRDLKVAHELATPEMYDSDLFAEESAAVARAGLARRREFAAGRAAARSTLRQLGQASTALPSDKDRLPIWPPGFVGSISHCDLACCAVSARQSHVLSLGVDLELAAQLEEGVVRLVVDDRERAAIASLPIAKQAYWPMIVFSAKEAFYKAYFPLTRTFLSFLDVLVVLTQEGADEGTFEVVSINGTTSEILANHTFLGRWYVEDGLVLAAAAIL